MLQGCYNKYTMAKNRKKRDKKYRGESAAAPQAATVHRYSAEDEDRKEQRKKLKIKTIAVAILIGILLLLGLVIL